MKTELATADTLGRAAVYGCLAHTGQFRDDGTTPYAVHLFRVADYLRTIAHEQDIDVLCAAYLHDTIEDTDTDFDTLAKRFGESVASLVAELSNDNRLPKAQRREAMLAHIPHISARAKRIKLADRLDNVTDLMRGGIASKDKGARYIEETARIMLGCEGACPPLEAALRDAYDELKRQYAQKYFA
ncbi:MAG: HD domain-containing protein [Planctomycetota bacterium]